MRNPEQRKTPPKPPQRVSSLDRKNSSSSNRESIITVIHVNGSAGSSREDLVVTGSGDGGDSGRDTAGSSAAEVSSPRQGQENPTDVATALLDGDKRDNNLKYKTAINACNIPSMCVITPPLSDDDSVRSSTTSSTILNNAADPSVTISGEDPALGSVAAKALLFQGGPSSGGPHNAVRQVPRIETAKTSSKSVDGTTTATVVTATTTATAAPHSHTLCHSASVDYAVNVRPSLIKHSDLRRLSGDVSPLPAQQQPQVCQQSKIQKVPPPPPPREDSIESASGIKIVDSNSVAIFCSEQLNVALAAPGVAGAGVPQPPSGMEPLQPVSALPPVLKQNLVITPTSSLERRKPNAGAHVTLDCEGKVLYSSDSLPRRAPNVSVDTDVSVGTVDPLPPPFSVLSGTRQLSVSSIQQVPLPQPPSGGDSMHQPHLPQLHLEDISGGEDAALQQQQLVKQQFLPQQVIQQQQQHLQQQQLQQQLLREDELLLQRTVQAQVDASKMEVLQQQSALKQQHLQLQQQLHETRLEIQRQQQEQQQKLQALRERQAYLQSKTPPKSSSASEKKQQHKLQEQINKEITKQQQQHKQQEQQRQLQMFEQQKQLQLMEQQKQIQLHKQQQLQELQHQQQQFQQQQMQQQQHLLQQEQQYQQQLQQHALYGPRQDPYLYPSVPLTGMATLAALAQLPPIVPPPPPPTDARPPPDGGRAGGVIPASSGVSMSPRSQRGGAYVHVQGGDQVAAQHQAGQCPVRPHSTQALYPSQVPQSTSRAPTPIQGTLTCSPHHTPFTVASTPQQQQQQLAAHLHNNSGAYGSQRSLQNFGLANDTASGFPPPGFVSLSAASPTPYSAPTLTDSDIYGRIGMTRQVQVGGTLPTSFGRHQRGYTSLPSNRRQPPHPLPQGSKTGVSKPVSRRASVAGDEGRGRSNPSTPEKLLEKEKKSSRKDKDRDKEKKKKDSKDKDKEKENKDSKSEKSPKKKWFWTLPLRRKKKTKDEGEDDDGGFKAASVKGSRKVTPAQDASFLRPSASDTPASDLTSLQSSDASDHSGYRSSPSAEVNYYSQRAQYMQQKQHMQQQHLLHLQHQQHQQLLQQQLQAQHQQQLLLQQQQQQSGSSLRSLPTTPISSPDVQGSFVNSSPLTISADVTDLTVTDLTRPRRYMSRDEMYSAMRHPQYYNYNRHSYAGSDEANNNSNTTPSSSRSASPAVFGVSPLPATTVRPQVRERPSSNDDYVNRDLQDTPIPFIFKENGFDELKFCTVEPPEGYGEAEATSSDGDDAGENEDPASSTSSVSGTTNKANNKPLSKQTTLFDFKKMILQQSMNTAGGKERISAVEMLRASRPSIYGYAPPPAPIVKPSQPQSQRQQQPSQQEAAKAGTVEGVIMPPTSRNTARALLFQSRFGSGRRFRASKTEIISTTILEDHGGELSEEQDMEESEEENGEETSGCEELSPRSTLAEPVSPTQSLSRGVVMHSTPHGAKGEAFPITDISCIEASSAIEAPAEDSTETAL